VPNGSYGARRRDEDDHDADAVRPYAVTGGRTTVSVADLPMEALVEGLVEPDVRLSSERRRILELTATQYQSIAELSAHVRLPVGVVRVLVSELAEARKVRVHTTPGLGTSTSPTGSSRESTAATLSVLESVLNGISSL
jgi:hypothetical protein